MRKEQNMEEIKSEGHNLGIGLMRRNQERTSTF